ncbi:hypothetical protein GF314_04650 [bacterium]|nr:hypothetical protein [bacterium]
MKTRTLIIVATLVALLGAGQALAQDLEPLVPQARIVSPPAVIVQHEAVTLTTEPTFRFICDYDIDPIEAYRYRYLIKPALLPDGSYADTRIEYEANADQLIAWDEAGWTAWTAWPDADMATIRLDALPVYDDEDRRISYLLAVQVMAADGVVSRDLAYGQSVANFRVSESLTPRLAVRHPLLGTWQGGGLQFQGAIDLLAGLEGGFEFEAEAIDYGADIASYRWGWDLLDPDDPNDPGWAVEPGIGDEQTHTPPLPFTVGVHTLTVQVFDTLGSETRFQLVLTFVPMPDPADQRSVLLVDDVRDRNSQSWTDADGIPRDRDEYRDAFWNEVLGGVGGVAGFDAQADVLDSEAEDVTLRDVVHYRTVVWSGRWASQGTTVANRFRPTGHQHAPTTLKYVWLGAYQESGGNVLLTGSRAALNFLPESPYVLPVVFESDEGSPFNGYGYIDQGIVARLGFGQDDFGAVYPRLYPYRDLGMAAVEVTAPSAAYYTADGQLINQTRRAPCVGLKGLVLDDAFVDANMGGVAAFADTIWTETAIDWTDDPDPEDGDVLAHSFLWGDDEFYDADVSDRNTPFTVQDCEGEDCVEPMWRTVARLDWVRAQRQAADPEDTWPEGYYGDPGEPGLDDYCGQRALDDAGTSALTSDQVTGFVTRKHLAQKPSGAGDVVLGFDPYRFDHEAMTEALRWVLGEHFGLVMTP